MYRSLLLLLISLLNGVTAFRDANQRFKSCCARQKDADLTCKRQFCDFSVLSQNNILAFTNLCGPRGSTLKDMWDCVTSKTDHTECCKSKKVIKECLPYCSHTGYPRDHLRHLFCLQAFNPIRDCFRDYLVTHPNIFGEE